MTTLLFPTPTLAVEVEPARLELAVPLDEPTQAELTLTNRGPRAVGVKISAGPYRHFQSGLSIPSAQDWITFEPPFFTLAPDAQSTVAVVVRPPLALVNDPAGEYLAAILVDELPAEPGQAETGSSRVTIVPRIALPVYVMIRGRERVEVEITGLSAQVSRPEGGGPVWGHSAKQGVPPGPPPLRSAELLRLDTTLRNHGSVHTRPAGNMALFDDGGRVVQAMGLGKSPPLLPTATLTLPTILPLPPPGRYKAVVTVEAQDRQLLQREHRFEVTEEGEVIPGATP